MSIATISYRGHCPRQPLTRTGALANDGVTVDGTAAVTDISYTDAKVHGANQVGSDHARRRDTRQYLWWQLRESVHVVDRSTTRLPPLMLLQPPPGRQRIITQAYARTAAANGGDPVLHITMNAATVSHPAPTRPCTRPTQRGPQRDLSSNPIQFTFDELPYRFHRSHVAVDQHGRNRRHRSLHQ